MAAAISGTKLTLRENATIYDALYLALAETLEATLVTRDRRLIGVPGLMARVEVLANDARSLGG